MIAYTQGLRPRLGQVAYATPYPPGGLEWGQGWGRFAPSSPKVVLPRSPKSGGGVGYMSDGTVLSQQDIEEIQAAGGSLPAGVPAGSSGGSAAPAAEGSKFPLVAAGVAVAAILTSMIA